MAAPSARTVSGLLRCASTFTKRIHILSSHQHCRGRWKILSNQANVSVFLETPCTTFPLNVRHLRTCTRLHQQQEQTEPSSPSLEDQDYHSIIKDAEKGQGPTVRHEFQAETRMLLDIVAKSLYSEKEVFIRELISNASDALEKLRYQQLTANTDTIQATPLEIHIATEKMNRTFTIQDTGIGMTKEEMIENLGTIARSGSKAFLEELKTRNEGGPDNITSIIGQFGVGFYSAFMVAEQVEVFSRTADSKGHKWTSDGSGTYELSEAEGVQQGTKIVLRLKTDCREFADEDTIKDVIKKYSNFVGSPIYLNGKKANTLQVSQKSRTTPALARHTAVLPRRTAVLPGEVELHKAAKRFCGSLAQAVWLMDPKQVTKEDHDEFYRFISGSYDVPRYHLHYSTDVPLSIRCLLYVPEGKPGHFDLTRETESGLALYCRKVLIKSKAENVLPKWLRFVKGVVDSEDIPLNLSRELLQDSSLIRKIRTVITNRLVRHLYDQMQKDSVSYDRFFEDYGLFIKEGILTSQEQSEKEEIAKLLRFESSLKSPGEKVTLAEYCHRMKEGQKDIYYLAAPSRELAESSPYFEAVKDKNVEVLFCFETYDEIVLVQLRQFNRSNVTSVETEMQRDKEKDPLDNLGDNHLKKPEAKDLIGWMKSSLGHKVHQVKATQRLSQHPCLVSVQEMAAARHFVKTSMQQIPEEQRYHLLQPTLELNLSHPIVMKLSVLKDNDPQLAELITHQLFDNAMVSAGLVDDPRKVTGRLTELFTKLLQKH